MQLVDKHKLDLLFLDIQMPKLSGIKLSSIIKGKVNIIFTTAYPQFAIDGFELNAIDYLLKPISFKRFIEAIEKVRNKIQVFEEKNNLFQNDEFFFVKTVLKKAN